MKKYFGVPVVAWIALLATVSIAAAWYVFATITTTTDVLEPLSVGTETEFTTTMYPGETNTWSWPISNDAQVAYSIQAVLTYSAPNGVTITSFIADGLDATADLTDDGTATFSIPAGGTISCSLTITAAGDATPGAVDIGLDLSRA